MKEPKRQPLPQYDYWQVFKFDRDYYYKSTPFSIIVFNAYTDDELTIKLNYN